MTLYQYRLLSPEVQLHYALNEGQYLAQRWEQEHQGVNLYFCDDGGRGFFVEGGYRPGGREHRGAAQFQ